MVLSLRAGGLGRIRIDLKVVGRYLVAGTTANIRVWFKIVTAWSLIGEANSRYMNQPSV
jgi:hypothetical protein